jgi:uncharacterized DUF497 family protein
MFEFDPVKSKSNFLKHGIDFEQAQQLWNDSDRAIVAAKFVSEIRYLLIAKLNNIYWSAIYTNRNSKIRIISVRKSRENEKEIYHS